MICIVTRMIDKEEVLNTRMMPVVLLVVISLLAISLHGCSEGGAAEQAARPDIINIDGMKSFGELERTSVQFPHDLHTEALKEQDKDCTVCHPIQENGRLSPMFKRLADTGKQEVMDLYHDNCLACHNENAAADSATGPVTCGNCHRQESVYKSSRWPFGFDKSLHYRHIKANTEKCEACHHVYDEEQKKLIYIKGKESSCRDCHRKQVEDNRISFKLAAHQDCIGCHWDITRNQPLNSKGPQSCGGCHDLERQAAVEVVEEPPRLKRNQPDFILLSVSETDLGSSKLNTVPFSHIGHERFTTTCRTCHHETLSRCVECHTLAGSNKGGEITLQQAMHSLKSDHSCIGCHHSKKSTTSCAGCHDLMEKGRPSEHACNICHAGPPAEVLEDVRALYKSLDDFRPKPSEIKLRFAASEVPESIAISVLSSEYRQAVMPHRKIVNTLIEHIKSNRIATHFHGHEDVACQGCHHHGSIGKRPALCRNCHGKPFNEIDLFKPGLYGAYHRKCIGCHISMDIKEPSKCAVCHEKKRLTNETNDIPTNSAGE